MDHWLSRRFSFREHLSLLLLFFMLTSCGSVESSAPSTPVGANSTEALQNLKPAYNYDKSQTIAGLFIKLHGFICTEGPYLSNLTVATSQLSYDAGSAQLIQNYLQLLTNNAVVDISSDKDSSKWLVTSWIPPQPPKELQWVPGSTTCKGNIAITNTAHTPIEIHRLGMQLTAAPVINSYHYQRVAIQPQCNGCGAQAPCGYQVSVILNGGVTGSRFDSPVTSTDSVSCPLPITIPGLESAELSITFRDASMRDLIYTGTPTIEISSSQNPIAISDLTSSLSFTHTDNLPCDQFQKDSFVPC